jgi:hypothetical protein
MRAGVKHILYEHWVAEFETGGWISYGDSLAVFKNQIVVYVGPVLVYWNPVIIWKLTYNGNQIFWFPKDENWSQLYEGSTPVR